MTSLTIGSVAMHHHGVGNRVPKDCDVFSPETGLWPDQYDVFWHPTFSEWIPEGSERIATLDELYTIKVSHSYWELPNGSWSKHMYDILDLKRAGAKLDLDLHKKLYKVWEETHGKKVMNLDQDKTEFFDDAVRRIYDHDSLHDSVAFGDRPIYEEILKDGASVDIDSRKLWALPHEQIVKLFIEEICVTALERIVIPKNYKASPSGAYFWALRRTITSLTKGRSARFIVENFEEFKNPDPGYVQRHLDNAHKLIRLGE